MVSSGGWLVVSSPKNSQSTSDLVHWFSYHSGLNCSALVGPIPMVMTSAADIKRFASSLGMAPPEILGVMGNLYVLGAIERVSHSLPCWADGHFSNWFLLVHCYPGNVSVQPNKIQKTYHTVGCWLFLGRTRLQSLLSLRNPAPAAADHRERLPKLHRERHGGRRWFFGLRRRERVHLVGEDSNRRGFSLLQRALGGLSGNNSSDSSTKGLLSTNALWQLYSHATLCYLFLFFSSGGGGRSSQLAKWEYLLEQVVQTNWRLLSTLSNGMAMHATAWK